MGRTDYQLQDIDAKVLGIVSTRLPTRPQWTTTTLQMMMEFYNVSGECDEEDDMRAVDNIESKGSRNIEPLDMPNNKFKQPLTIKKVNIGKIEDGKFFQIGDQWDDSKMGKFIDILNKFQDLILTIFFEMN